jgi:hypothetical protein
MLGLGRNLVLVMMLCGDVAAVRREKFWIFHSMTSPCVLLIDGFNLITFQPTEYSPEVYLDPSFSMTMPNENNSKKLDYALIKCLFNRTTRKSIKNQMR